MIDVLSNIADELESVAVECADLTWPSFVCQRKFENAVSATVDRINRDLVAHNLMLVKQWATYDNTITIVYYLEHIESRKVLAEIKVYGTLAGRTLASRIPQLRHNVYVIRVALVVLVIRSAKLPKKVHLSEFLP